MKKVVIRRRRFLKYFPSYKFESIGFHEDGKPWFYATHLSKSQALAEVYSLKGIELIVK